jgi:hypothetical protein
VSNEKVGVDRAGILERFHESQGISVDATVEAEASLDNALSQSNSDAQPVADKSDAAPVAAPAEEVVKDPGAKDAKVEKSSAPKMVPEAALHEEREKRKAKTLENRQLAESLANAEKSRAELEQRVKDLESQVRGDVPEHKDDEITKQLAEENKKLKEEKQKAEAERQKAARTASDTAMAEKIKAADAQLASEGFPGFQHFTVDVHNAIVAKIQAGELDEKDVNEALWSKVYKEEVYMAKKAIFDAQVKQEKLNAKLKAKKDANLSNKPGEAPHAREEEDKDAPQTPESYMKFRKVLK